jgi:hypothetical protein
LGGCEPRGRVVRRVTLNSNLPTYLPTYLSTYIRKKKGIQAFQLRPDIADQETLSDILLLQISARIGQSTLIYNIYNAPISPTSIRPGKAIQVLMNLLDTYFSQPALLAGDFNLLYSR